MMIQRSFKMLGLAAALSLSFSGQSLAEGSRYDLPREYQSEISSAKAYLEMKKQESVLFDVRRLREYAAGHPERAFNVPYPHKVDSNDQRGKEAEVYWAIYNIVGGKTDTPITTLCRTGFRSVLVANILADPLNTRGEVHPSGPLEGQLIDPIIGAEPFTNVRNIWEGFVGRYKAVDGTADSFLDLNNNDVLDVDVADVYSHTKDANPDKDGWRNYQELPWDTKLHVNRVYLNDRSQYDPFVE
jgi:rhodanese-related sulfurtransferase